MKSACALLFLLFASASPAWAAGGLARVRAQGELRWGGDLQGGAPYVFQDPRDPSHLVGFEVEIADAPAKRLGVKATFVQNDWHNLLPSLLRGDFDVILNGLEDMPSVRDRVLVSRPYFRFSEQLVVRKGSPLTRLKALEGHRVGTLASSLAHAMLKERPGIDTVLYEGVDEPYRDLELKRVDGVLLDSVIAQRFGLTKPDLVLADGDVARGSYVLAVRRGDEDLRDAVDGALQDLERTGELAAILARWNLHTLPPAAPSEAPALAQDVQAHFDSGEWLLFLKGAGVTLFVSLLALAVPLGLLLALARLHGGAHAGAHAGLRGGVSRHAGPSTSSITGSRRWYTSTRSPPRCWAWGSTTARMRRRSTARRWGRCLWARRRRRPRSGSRGGRA